MLLIQLFTSSTFYLLIFFNLNLLTKSCLANFQTIIISKCCLCYPYICLNTKYKLCYHFTKCIFLGYNPLHQGYLCFDNDLGRLFVTRHVIFYDTTFPFQPFTNSSMCASLIASHQSSYTPTLLPISSMVLSS